MAGASPGSQKRLAMPGIFRHSRRSWNLTGKLGADVEDTASPGLGWRCSPEKAPVKPHALTADSGCGKWATGMAGQDCCPGLRRPLPPVRASGRAAGRLEAAGWAWLPEGGRSPEDRGWRARIGPRMDTEAVQGLSAVT